MTSVSSQAERNRRRAERTFVHGMIGASGTSAVGVILDLTRLHNSYVAGRVDLVASNAWVSAYARLAMGSALSNSYCIGFPGNRWYGGCAYIDMIEREVVSLATRLFGTGHAVVQFLSGMQANIGAFNALLRPGDKVVSAPPRHGGHYSHGPNGPLRFFSAKVLDVPFDPSAYNVDLDGLRDLFERERPRMIIVGWSEFLFPHPLRAIRELCDRYDVRLMYDMSHVAGLIAGGSFQPEAGRLADVLTSSTGKSLHAPDHGMLLYNDVSLEPAIKDAIMPLLTSNTHPQEVAAVGIALAEMDTFGADYARQVVANTKALGAALHERGVNVMYRELGYSDSHTLLVQHDHAQTAVSLLDAAGITANTAPLPWDDSGPDRALRLGTQVLTRRGMREPQMHQVAEALGRLLVERDDPRHVGDDLVKPLAEGFRHADYSFDAHFPLPGDWQNAPYEPRRGKAVTDMAALVPAFSSLSIAELHHLADKLRVVELAESARLFSEGDPADGVYFIVDGAIAISDEHTHRVANLGPGDHLGEAALLSDRRRTMNAYAASRATLLRVDAADFRDLLTTSPSVRRHFDAYVSSLRLADRARAETDAA
jgi:glycine hydroxymethyltransferase